MSDRQIIIEEVGKPPASHPPAVPTRFDLQDYLIVGGILAGEAAALVIWWPAALILACLFCFLFASLIQMTKPKEKRGNPQP